MYVTYCDICDSRCDYGAIVMEPQPLLLDNNDNSDASHATTTTTVTRRVGIRNWGKDSDEGRAGHVV
jgi:hypothetical protein